MNLKLLFFTLPIVVFGLTSCVNNSEEDLYGLECDTLNMTYSNVKYIFEDNCYVCHTTPQGSLMIKLDSYIDVKAAVNTGRLEPAINWTGTWKMPNGRPKLDDCLIAKIEAWINAGMPE